MIIKLISTVLAADIDTGKGIIGIGPFQEAMDQSAVKTGLGELLSSLITTITVVGSLAFVVFFTIGGLKWITAGGDKTKITEAQNQMTQGAIGLIAIVASFFLIGIVGAVLGIDILNPFHSLFPTL